MPRSSFLVRRFLRSDNETPHVGAAPVCASRVRSFTAHAVAAMALGAGALVTVTCGGEAAPEAPPSRGNGGTGGAGAGSGGSNGSGSPNGGSSSSGGNAGTGAGSTAGGTPLADAGTLGSGGAGGGTSREAGTVRDAGVGRSDANSGNDTGVGRAVDAGTAPRAVDAGSGPGAVGVTCTGASTAPSPAPWEKLMGWASVAETGVTTVTGGGSAAAVDATSMEQLQTLFAGTAPAVIRVVGTLSGQVTLEGSNKTILGAAGSAIHGMVTLKRASNVILRNLTVVGDNCADKPECKGGTDALSVTFASHHLWFDHCDVSDASDGNLDIKDGSDLITVSWTKFHYTTPGRAHRFSSLIGHSDSETAAMDDMGKLRVTFHHDWWADNVFERMPRVRFGQVHVFNNLYTSANNNYCVRAGFQADIRSEHNAFVGVNNPFDLEDPTGKLESFDDLFKQIKGTTVGAGTAFKPPYAYTMESACTVEASVRANAGPR